MKNLLAWLVGLFREKEAQTEEAPKQSKKEASEFDPLKVFKRFCEGCTHPPHSGEERVKMEVLGCEISISFPKGTQICPDCMRQYLEQQSTRCAHCKKPIFPGDPVGKASTGSDHSYTHLTEGCCISAGVYCGIWGEGVLFWEEMPIAKAVKTKNGVGGIIPH